MQISSDRKNVQSWCLAQGIKIQPNASSDVQKERSGLHVGCGVQEERSGLQNGVGYIKQWATRRWLWLKQAWRRQMVVVGRPHSSPSSSSDKSCTSPLANTSSACLRGCFTWQLPSISGILLGSRLPSQTDTSQRNIAEVPCVSSLVVVMILNRSKIAFVNNQTRGFSFRGRSFEVLATTSPPTSTFYGFQAISRPRWLIGSCWNTMLFYLLHSTTQCWFRAPERNARVLEEDLNVNRHNRERERERDRVSGSLVRLVK